jgi:hypothetical protein
VPLHKLQTQKNHKHVALKKSEQKDDTLQISVHFKNSKVPSHKREEQWTQKY